MPHVQLLHSARTRIPLPEKSGDLRITGRTVQGRLQWRIETPYLDTAALCEVLLYLNAVYAEAPTKGQGCLDAAAWLKTLPGFEAVTELEADLSVGGLITTADGQIDRPA